MSILNLGRDTEKGESGMFDATTMSFCLGLKSFILISPSKPFFIADSTVLQPLHHHPSLQVDNLSHSALLLGGIHEPGGRRSGLA